MPTITEFSANMSKGFARPNLFKVAISKVKVSEQPRYEMSCFQAQIPGHNIATTDKDIGFRSIAYQKIFSDIILGFYVDADLSQLKFWQSWIDTIINKNTNHHAYYNDYVGLVTITQQNRMGDPVATWTLHEAYPKQVDPIQLDYGTNDAVMTCNATITYRHFTVKWHTTVETEKDTGKEKLLTTNTKTDMHNIDILEPLKKRVAQLRITQDEFDEMYPAFDKMNKSDQRAVLFLYGEDNPHGDSESGGALHMVTL